MKLTFFFFLLSFLRGSGWCRALGPSCPEETCFQANRESCSLGSIQCGSCLQGFFEVEGSCLPIESSPNDDDSWESELEGTDGSDLNVLFDTTQSPSTTKHTKKQQNSPDSSPDSIDFIPPSAPATAVEENSNNLNNKNDDLEGKIAAKDAESSLHGTDDNSKQNGAKKIHSSNDFNSKSKELKNRGQDGNLKRKFLLKKQDKELQRKHKEMDDREKLNKFLSKKDGTEEVVSSDKEDGVNMEGNSSSNPPPFIRKHKIGKEPKASEMDDIYFLFIVIGCSVAGIAGLGLAGYCWYKLHTTAKAVSESEYTGYAGMKGSTKRPPSLHGDDKLDYNAEMYHYQQTKSQLAAMEKAGSKSSKQGSMEDDENSDEGDEGDYTVYECPGLAPTGDMTVVNPLFSDQEAVGSDQDANGNRSGQSSPTSSKHSTTTKSAE